MNVSSAASSADRWAEAFFAALLAEKLREAAFEAAVDARGGLGLITARARHVSPAPEDIVSRPRRPHPERRA